MIESCYVPSSQTACEVNSCYGRGICTTRGTCIMCREGYSGEYCEIRLKENNEDIHNDNFDWDWDF